MQHMLLCIDMYCDHAVTYRNLYRKLYCQYLIIFFLESYQTLQLFTLLAWLYTDVTKSNFQYTWL